MSGGYSVSGYVAVLMTAGFTAGFLSAAAAQDAGYNLDLAPGYDTPDRQVQVRDRDLVQLFNSSPVTGDSQFDRPINEFAGQTQRFDPGLIGAALGGMKRGLVDSFDRE